MHKDIIDRARVQALTKVRDLENGVPSVDEIYAELYRDVRPRKVAMGPISFLLLVAQLYSLARELWRIFNERVN